MANFFVAMLQSLGTIFGPLMLLAGLAAFIACWRATVRAERVAARRSLVWSLTPLVLGVVGALFGAAVWGFSRPVGVSLDWAALGYTVLFGVFVAAVPVTWSLALLGRRPNAVA